jgi:hypothetical protein
MKPPWWLEVSRPRLAEDHVVVDCRIRPRALPWLVAKVGLPMIHDLHWWQRPRGYAVLAKEMLKALPPFVVDFTDGGVA